MNFPSNWSVDLKPMSAHQKGAVDESVRALEVLRLARERSAQSRGGMHWKTVHGRQYLYQTHGGSGKCTSLGVMGPETESLMKEFASNKIASAAALKNAVERLQLQASFNQALKISVLPNRHLVMDGLALPSKFHFYPVVDLPDSCSAETFFVFCLVSTLLQMRCVPNDALAALIDKPEGFQVWPAMAKSLMSAPRQPALMVTKSGRIFEVNLPDQAEFLKVVGALAEFEPVPAVFGALGPFGKLAQVLRASSASAETTKLAVKKSAPAV